VVRLLSSGMPAPWSQRLIRELLDADARARAVAHGLDAAALNLQPGPARWSIGQCLDHLRVANVVYLGAMAPALAGPPGRPVEAIRPGWLGRWFIRNHIEPQPGMRKGRAPGKIRPVALVDRAILERFPSNGEVRAFVEHAAGYDVNQLRFRNPFVPVVRFTVGTGLEILVRHQRRHLLQAEQERAEQCARGFRAGTP